MKKIQFKGKKFFYSMMSIYLLIFFFDNDNSLVAIKYSIDIFNQIWPLFLVIILISTLINYFLDPKQVIKHFGKDSGNKAIFYSLLAGIISHGPMYTWYGLLEELREKGVKDELLIVFFYSRAIKIPMIPFSIAVFGTTFTIIISLYILLFAILQGKLFTYFWKKF